MTVRLQTGSYFGHFPSPDGLRPLSPLHTTHGVDVMAADLTEPVLDRDVGFKYFLNNSCVTAQFYTTD